MTKSLVCGMAVLFAVTVVPCLAADEPAKQPAPETAAGEAAGPNDNKPPEGFVALFNGKDLTGWKGLMGAPLDNPVLRAQASKEQFEKSTKYANGLMKQHWTVKDGILHYDGKGKSLATAKDYGDFEMMVDWKIQSGGDSGIYLRGTPQVQIWDPNKKPAAGVGSGGLYNNFIGAHDPLKRADKPVGEWNSFWIKMVGDKVWVKLNGELVVDGVVMENYWLRELEQARQKAEKSEGKGPSTRPVGPMFPTGQIELQHHRSPLAFKNIYIKELPR